MRFCSRKLVSCDCTLAILFVTTKKRPFAAKYDQPAEPGEERSSVALIQLERQNERLKEALVR
jgi:hypothetical protein